MRKLGDHFHVGEFRCHDGAGVPDELLQNLQRLVSDVLDPVRRQWGGPLTVVSGYRTSAWNKRVGGAKASTHVTAEGADIRPGDPDSVAVLHTLILRMHSEGRLPGLGGLGRYGGWVHVDVRKAPDGHLRRWDGTGQGSEP